MFELIEICIRGDVVTKLSSNDAIEVTNLIKKQQLTLQLTNAVKSWVILISVLIEIGWFVLPYLFIEVEVDGLLVEHLVDLLNLVNKHGEIVFGVDDAVEHKVVTEVYNLLESIFD